jgi:hypothetical protein
VLIGLLFTALPARAQDAVTGTVVSSTPNTLTISTGPDRVQLFVFARNVRKPATLATGSQVRVVSTAGSEPDVRVASEITVVPSANTNQAGGDAAVIPDAVRRLERDIEREVRRFQVGVRAGVGLDPEIVFVGVQAQMGPLFRSDVFFRPSVDFGLGEVTAMFALSGDIIYRLPFSSAQDRWSTYAGAGLGVNLLHRNFEEEGEEDGRRIDFGEFRSDTALNILGGVRRRGGMFLELKTTVYSGPSPTLRVIVGYTF